MRKFTPVVLESADVSRVTRYEPDGSTISPWLLLEVIDRPEYEILIRQALEDEASNPDGIHQRYPYAGVADRFAASIGTALLDAAPGALTTACDPRLARDADALVDRCRRIVGLHASRGHHGRVTVTLPATWEGLRAAEQLRREGIHTNIDHVFSLPQAAAAADVKPTMITVSLHPPQAPPDTHPAPLPVAASSVDLDSTDVADAGACDAAAVAAAHRAFYYCKRHRVAARVAVAGVRTLAEARAVAGADGLTLSPRVFRQLVNCMGPLPRELEPLAAHDLCSDELMAGLTEAEFHEMLAADAVATEKLERALEAAAWAQHALEARLRAKAAAWDLPVLPERPLVYAD